MEHKDIKGFLRFLAQATEHLPVVGEEAMKAAADLILREQKREIGHYQRDNLPDGVNPWKELSESTKQDRVQGGFSPNDPGERSGEMKESYNARVSGPGALIDASIGSDLQTAVWFEEGTEQAGGHQPPRDISAVAAFRKEHQVVDVLGGWVAHSLSGNGRGPKPSELDEGYRLIMEQDD